MKESNLLKVFGQNVRKHRTTKGYSQEKLAQITGLHRTYIGSLERGERNVTLINVIKLSRALDIKISDLFEGTE